MSVRLYRGDAAVDTIDPAHRGIAYGDGLFETMRIHAGRVHWWDRHMARLAHGALRLRLGLPDPGFVISQAAELTAGTDQGVLKLIVSRGTGGRGYASAPDAPADWQLSLHPLPAQATEGIALRWCETRLSYQPLLAGLKHCNRLEQVLARAEWDHPDASRGDADEGLMLDRDGHVVSGVSSNLFVLRSSRWATPSLASCGVAGICRSWAMAALDAAVLRLEPVDVQNADAVFLCNAVRGILPVARLGGRTWRLHPAIEHAQQLLAAEHPAFAPAATLSEYLQPQSSEPS